MIHSCCSTPAVFWSPGGSGSPTIGVNQCSQHQHQQPPGRGGGGVRTDLDTAHRGFDCWEQICNSCITISDTCTCLIF